MVRDACRAWEAAVEGAADDVEERPREAAEAEE